METNAKSGMPIRRVMREMNIGDVIQYNISKMSCVRSTASILGVELDRKYVVKQDREKRVVEVTREK